MKSKIVFSGDITKPELREQIFNETIQKFERVDILVNNAGRGIVGNILDMTMEQYQEIFDVNVTATVHLSKLCLPYIRKIVQFHSFWKPIKSFFLRLQLTKNIYLKMYFLITGNIYNYTKRRMYHLYHLYDNSREFCGVKLGRNWSLWWGSN